MTDNDIPSPTPEETPQPESKITVTFPAGVHTTGLTLGINYVDAAQLELAGHFLVRQAESLYAQAAATQQPKIVVPSPGAIQGIRQ